MPWLRTGDTAATYPAMLAVAGTRGADDRLVNEVFGFVMRCAMQSAAHTTDYVVDAGTADMIGGGRTRTLTRLCEKVGVFIPTSGAVRAWSIIDDPEFVHMRLREEITWERQQRNDTRDPAIRVPVLRRDGDNCRWCGVLVQWRGKRTGRTATLDHLVPGQAGTPQTMVVACLACNSGRADNRELWDDNHQMRPAPAEPRFGKVTAAYLSDHGYPTEPNVASDGRPADIVAPDPARARVRPAEPARPTAVRPADPAPDAVRPGTASPTDTAPLATTGPDAHTRSVAPRVVDTARPPAVRPATRGSTGTAAPRAPGPDLGSEVVPKSAPNSIRQVDRTTLAGSGRDSSGTPTEHSPGRPPPHGGGLPSPSPVPRRRRGRRTKIRMPEPEGES